MFNQIASKVLATSIVATLIVVLAFMYFKSTAYDRYVWWQYLNAHFQMLIGGHHATIDMIQPWGQKQVLNAEIFANSHLMQWYLGLFKTLIFESVMLSLGLWVVSVMGLFYFLKQRGKAHTEDKYVKGDTIVAPEVLKKQLEHAKKASDIQLGKPKLPLVLNAELQHIGLDGTTGAGKTNTLYEILDLIRLRGERAIIFDENGNFLKYYFRQDSDHLLNGLDLRSHAWDLWAECYDKADFESMAVALIPLGKSQDPFWVLGARTIFVEAAFKMRADKDKSIRRLRNILMAQSLDEMQDILKGTMAESLVDEKIEKTAISIKAILSAYLKSLYYVKEGKNPFSIRDWVQNERDDSWLFVSAKENKREALRPLTTAWLDLAISEALSLEDNSCRRLWIFLDEVATLNKLPSLESALARGRKKGLCVVIGTQNNSMLRNIYGHDSAEAISGLLNTRIFFRQTDPKIASWSASNFGERVIEEVKEGLSYGANTMRDGVNLNRVETRKPLLNASDIMRLNNLECWVRYPGSWPVTKLSFDYHKKPARVPAFVPRLIEEDPNLETSVVVEIQCAEHEHPEQPTPLEDCQNEPGTNNEAFQKNKHAHKKEQASSEPLSTAFKRSSIMGDIQQTQTIKTINEKTQQDHSEQDLL